MRTVTPAFSILLFALLGLSSCVKSQKTLPVTPPHTTQIVPSVETGPFIVIGHLEHRDRLVTVKSGAAGTVFSARGKDGKILFENLTAEQLKVQSPDIHDFIDAATAGSARLMPSRPMESTFSKKLDVSR
jgi:hypothetical protein